MMSPFVGEKKRYFWGMISSVYKFKLIHNPNQRSSGHPPAHYVRRPFKGGLKNSYFELKFISLKHTFSFYDSIPVW